MPLCTKGPTVKNLIKTILAVVSLAGCSHEGVEHGSRAAGYYGNAGIASVKGAGHYAVCGGREFAAALRGEHGPKAQAIAQDECNLGRDEMGRASEDVNRAQREMHPAPTAPPPAAPSQ